MHLTSFNIKNLGTTILHSYSQVFFSNNKVLAAILMVVSFFDYTSGFSGLLAVLAGVFLVEAMGMDKVSIQRGLYSFNNLLVGLGIGLNFQPSIQLFVIVVFASLLTTFFTFSIQGFLGKYNLSYLSIPFLFAIWISLLATDNFSVLGLSLRGIYSQNEIFALGGLELLKLYQNLEAFVPFVLVVYFKSLGAIFFQYNILAGFCIALGLLFYSRIMFSLSLLGYLMALAFYQVFGADITQMSYSYIGFNYILSAVAIGGYFLIPSGYSYLASILILPILVLLTFGFEHILGPFGVSIYSLPFNVLVLMFLYALRFRTHRPKYLREVLIQQETPEKNAYLQTNYVNRLRSSGIASVSLPFVGEWSVMQGYDGKYTHKGEWRHGLDFVVLNDNDLQYKGDGLLVEDYYCYDKNVIAPADGYVVDIRDDIKDNVIGEMDIIHNWGNTVVIQHFPGLNSQVSHLKKGSLEVKVGDFVQKGQLLGKVGNSGRSPYPHLHFQVQVAPYVGAKTLDYPLSNYITSSKNYTRYHAHGIPEQNQKLRNVIATPLIANAFRFNPSQEFTFKLSYPGTKSAKFKTLKTKYTFEVHSDVYKNTYFRCSETGAKAWFYTDGQMHYFSNYEGERNSFLFYFMLALFKVELGYDEKIVIKDQIPPHFTFKGIPLLLQDFVIPFYQGLKSEYELKFAGIDDDFTPQNARLVSKISNMVNNKCIKQMLFDVEITNEGLKEIIVNEDGNVVCATKIAQKMV